MSPKVTITTTGIRGKGGDHHTLEEISGRNGNHHPAKDMDDIGQDLHLSDHIGMSTHFKHS